MEIRRLRDDDDAAAAGRLVQAAYFALPDYPHEDAYDALLGDVAGRAKETEVIIGVLDGRLVACLTFVGDPDSPHNEFPDPEGASFRYFGVDPTVQGRGVGEAMVQWCIDEATRRSRRRLYIHTLVCMTGAQRLYERLGFRRYPEGDEWWDGIQGLAFIRDIGGSRSSAP
jgi:GNAT superfamily N-acetyltransferase